MQIFTRVWSGLSVSYSSYLVSYPRSCISLLWLRVQAAHGEAYTKQKGQENELNILTQKSKNTHQCKWYIATLQPTKQLKTTLVGVVLLSVWKKPPRQVWLHFRQLQSNIGSWLSVCNLILTQLERRPQNKMKTTWKKMGENEDDLKKIIKLRRPQFIFF